MGTNLPPNQSIPQLINTTPLSSINTVITVMQKLDAMLSTNDGVKWFNLLYLRVTQAVYEKPDSYWKNPGWLKKLDTTFASLYFSALASSYTTDTTQVPRAWMALFEARNKQDIERVQFALAGMNAHINHDLPLALEQTCKNTTTSPSRGTPEYCDFTKVNNILSAVQPEILNDLATGILGGAMQDAGTVGRLLSIWCVETARDTAWTNAELLWAIRDNLTLRENFLTGLDRMTGLASRGLLL